MSKIVVPNVGLVELLNRALQPPYVAQYHLYQNDVPLSSATLLDDFLECDFAGYADAEALWSGAGPLWPGALAEGSTLTWTWEGLPTNDVYGIYVTDDSGNLLWAQRDPDAPVTLEDIGATYTVVPRLTMLSQYGVDFTAILDDFEDVDGTDLADHTIAPFDLVGASWRSDDGVIEIQGDKAEIVSVGGSFRAIYSCDTLSADGFLTMSSLPPNTEAFFRLADVNNFLMVTYQGGVLYLYKRIAGTFTGLDSITLSVPPLYVETRGSEVRVYGATGLILRKVVTDLIGATRWGFGGFSIGAQFDKWQWALRAPIP